MQIIAKIVGWVLIAFACLMLIVAVIAEARGPALLMWFGGIVGVLIFAAFFFVLQAIVDHLADISSLLTWLMPKDYFEAKTSDTDHYFLPKH